MLALYEMLRVAKIGVVIIEPNDINLKLIRESQTLIKPKNKAQVVKDFIKDLFGIKRYEYNAYNATGYETAGNYIYSISEREVEKAALGLDLPVVAFKGLNDVYFDGVEFQQANSDSVLFKKIEKAIFDAYAECTNNGKPYNILVSIIFKSQPDEATAGDLRLSGFRVNYLPRNPYA